MTATIKAEHKIVVGIPAYNEEPYIGGIIVQCKQYADEIIVADDGSKDKTAKIAKLTGATTIEHHRNRGYGAAIQTIIAEAKDRDADILVILDADTQHDPDDIPLLVEAVKEGNDLVIGSRHSNRGSMPIYRRFGIKVLASFTNIAARGNIGDTESGFRAYSRKALESLELKEQGMAISAEIIAEASHLGLKIHEVPISIRYTKDGSTLNPVVHGASNLNRIINMISERRPLFFFGVAGVTFLIGSLISGIWVIRSFSASNVLATGWALVTMLLVTLGILSIFTGIILNTIVNRIQK